MKKIIRILVLIHHYYQNFIQKINIIYYKLHGRKPWIKGYSEFKWQYIQQSINNSQLIKKFKQTRNLPRKYGLYLDERVIEYPWMIANLPVKKGILLDAGSVLNFNLILKNKKLKNKKISIVNLNPEQRCFWKEGVSYFFDDLRKLPFKDNHFSVITCLSTLEHIGMDNTMIYIKDKKFCEKNPKDYLKVILELRRVLQNKGQLLITVPYGQYQNFGFQQQFDELMIKQVIKTFNPRRSCISYYKYYSTGWNISSQKECNDAQYFNIHTAEKHAPDLAAAARSVVCLKLIK